MVFFDHFLCEGFKKVTLSLGPAASTAIWSCGTLGATTLPASCMPRHRCWKHGKLNAVKSRSCWNFKMIRWLNSCHLIDVNNLHIYIDYGPSQTHRVLLPLALLLASKAGPTCVRAFGPCRVCRVGGAPSSPRQRSSPCRLAAFSPSSSTPFASASSLEGPQALKPASGEQPRLGNSSGPAPWDVRWFERSRRQAHKSLHLGTQ